MPNILIKSNLNKLSFSEIHIFWAQHQVHHSSEDFNLAVGLRQSVLQGWCGFVSNTFYHYSLYEFLILNKLLLFHFLLNLFLSTMQCETYGLLFLNVTMLIFDILKAYKTSIL